MEITEDFMVFFALYMQVTLVLFHHIDTLVPRLVAWPFRCIGIDAALEGNEGSYPNALGDISDKT
jgi:hypothetical protein